MNRCQVAAPVACSVDGDSYAVLDQCGGTVHTVEQRALAAAMGNLRSLIKRRELHPEARHQHAHEVVSRRIIESLLHRRYRPRIVTSSADQRDLRPIVCAAAQDTGQIRLKEITLRRDDAPAHIPWKGCCMWNRKHLLLVP